MPSSPRILVIDDDQDLLRLVGLLLKRVDAQTFLAPDGTTGMQLLQSHSPLDMLILDLMLPDIDGFDILARIRSKPEYDSLLVLILSAKADPVTIRQGLELGADSYVTKPYIANSLIDRVRALLASGRRVSE